MKSVKIKYKEVEGDLISLAQAGNFDVIAHGCNIHCVMGAGIAPQMARAFDADRFPLEAPRHVGDVNKLGQIDYQLAAWRSGKKAGTFTVVNAYTQSGFGSNHKNGTSKPADYDAITLVMRKMNSIFKGRHIGLPKIGCGLAGGSWRKVKNIIKRELRDCNVTIVKYKKK